VLGLNDPQMAQIALQVECELPLWRNALVAGAPPHGRAAGGNVFLLKGVR